MRFKLIFKGDENTLLPFNYQYELSAALYKIFSNIKTNNSRYSHINDREFLNQITFSRIEIPNREISSEGIKCFSEYVFLKLSIGFSDIGSDVLWKAFSIINNTLVIFKKFKDKPPIKIKLKLHDIEYEPPPVFDETMKFKMISPMVLTKGNFITKNKYLSLNEKDKFITRLKENLLKKFYQLHNKEIKIDSFSFELDPDYCDGKEKKDLHSLIKMKEGSNDSFSILGLLVPFRITAPRELIQVGYFSGFGEKTSLGFGMVEALQEHFE